MNFFYRSLKQQTQLRPLAVSVKYPTNLATLMHLATIVESNLATMEAMDIEDMNFLLDLLLWLCQKKLMIFRYCPLLDKSYTM